MGRNAVIVSRRTLLAGTITAPLLLAGTRGSSSNPSHFAGPFLPSKFNAIVRAVRNQSIAVGNVHRFRVDPDYAVSSLKPFTRRVRRGQGRGIVWAEWIEGGLFRLVIETRDYGHNGEAGYLYSDHPLKRANTVALGREWTVVDQASRHWWIVKYTLG